MDQVFLEYYRRNLVHLRELSNEFAAQFPKIASRLGISNLAIRDPFVERLLEGTAFMAAKVEQRFDDGYPLFLQSLLSRVCPLLNVPLPAALVARFTLPPDNYRITPLDINHTFQPPVSQHSSAVLFRPLWPLTLAPFEVEQLSYEQGILQLLPDGELKELDCRGVLSLKLSSQGTAQDSQTDQLFFYVNSGISDVSHLTYLLEHELLAVYAGVPGQLKRVRGVTVSGTLLSQPDNLLSKALGALPGICAMQLYLRYPQLFNFITLNGVSRLLEASGHARQFQVLFLLKKEVHFTRQLKSEQLLLNCAPLFNLFERRTDRVKITRERELLLEVDNAAPHDYEIFSVRSLELFDRQNALKMRALPFYQVQDGFDVDSGAFFAVRRSLRSRGLQHTRENYRKTDTWISLSGKGYLSSDDKLYELCGNIWCTNADLAVDLPRNTALSERGGTIAGSVLTLPLPPLSPALLRGVANSFDQLSYLMLNMQSLLLQSPQTALELLKSMVLMLCAAEDDTQRMLSAAIKKVSSAAEVFRHVRRGCVYFERGYRLSVTLNESDLAGHGLYFVGRVLREVFNDYTRINLPVAFDLYTVESGQICSWEPEPAVDDLQ
ncbi:MAG: type VI secretion system baseplate subunit TssF [Succinivibrio sp.]|nr:type VI secretion system baseplate subunit TssF [Succinivibrio sp.]